MTKWWQVWGGHVLAVVTIILTFLAMFLLWLSTRAEFPDERFVLGMGFIVVAVVAFCVGGFAAYHWNSARQRRAIRWLQQGPSGSHE